MHAGRCADLWVLMACVCSTMRQQSRERLWLAACGLCQAVCNREPLLYGWVDHEGERGDVPGCFGLSQRWSCGMCASATATLICHVASVLSAVWDAGLGCGGGNRALYGFGNRLSGTLPDVLSTWTALTCVMCISRDGCRALRLCVAARRLVVVCV